MKNGWTGGQYSVVRALLGLYLFVHGVRMVPWVGAMFSSGGIFPDGVGRPLFLWFPNILALWDTPVLVTALVVLAAGLSLLLACGMYDRVAAIGLWYIWACLYGRMPLIAHPSLPYVGGLLLAHACLPAAPYGSVAARGRSDPGQSWRLPAGIFLAAWVIMALGYGYSGLTKLASASWLDGSAVARILDNPLARPGVLRTAVLALPDGVLRLCTWGALGLELSFAPLALVPCLRPWLWSVLLLMHLSLIPLVEFADLSLGMVMLHLFTFDPAWLPPRPVAAGERMFYDGYCGLCHRTVRFVLAEDGSSAPFRFAPIGSEIFDRMVPVAQRATLPDSVIVQTAHGILLSRSRAMIYILCRLGGLWRLLGCCLGLFPTALCDCVYDAVARVRYRLFARPSDICPLLPAHLRARFEL